MQSLASIPEFEADPHQQTQKKTVLKMCKKLLSENNTKKSRKSEVDSTDSPSFLGLRNERKQKK